MMYSNKLAVAIKSNGKVLREVKDTVYLPFGSEYSVFVKNLNSVRALVRIEIDGEDVTNGTGLIVHGNSEIDLERFIRNNNLKEGNRFKFIERSAAVEQHRGIGVEDGLVRIEFQFEKPLQQYWNGWYNDWYKPQFPTPQPHWYRDVYYGDGYSTCKSPPVGGGDILRSRSLGGGTTTSCSITTSSVPMKSSYGDASHTFASNVNAQSAFTAQVNDAGVTVPGSVSDQEFVPGSWFPVEDTKHVIVLKLLGKTETKRVERAVTVKSKPKCVTCGRQNKATAKFCVSCGTSLQIVA